MDIFVVLLVCSFLGAAMLSRYNKGGTGFLLGLLLGPLGLLFALVIRSSSGKEEDKKRHEEMMSIATQSAVGSRPTPAAPSRQVRQCPHCAENILAAAKVCKHCNRDVEPIAEPKPGRKGTRRQCPHCSATILVTSEICIHCSKSVDTKGDYLIFK